MSGSIFVSSGEVSGDRYIAEVASRLLSNGETDVFGMAGAEARDAGVRALWHGERLQLLGAVEVLRAIPGLLRLKSEIVAEVTRAAPRAVVVADSPDFHLPLLAHLRRAGYRGKIFYISPPSVWAWRSGRVNALKRDVDVNFPLFEFEHDYLVSSGCTSLWRSHPLVDDFSKVQPAAGREQGVIALLPGSRGSELRALFPILSEVYHDAASQGMRPIFSVARGLSPHSRDYLTGELERGGYEHFEGPGRELIARAEAVVGSSGTATAEALLLRRYMVVLYRLHPISAIIGRLALRNRYFAIPNILAGEEFLPELIQERATAQNATAALFEYLSASPIDKKRIGERMSALADKMGPPGAYDFWAREISG